jgi:hypothetical protein
MRRLLPSWTELAIIITLAIIGAGVVATFQLSHRDLGLAALAAPVFVLSAVMGLRRSPVWQASDNPMRSGEPRQEAPESN